MRFVNPALTTPLQYDAIRGSIESAFKNFFNPPAFSASATYNKGDKVQLSGLVYEAEIDNPVDLPSNDWTELGPVYLIIYENVGTGVPANGAIKVEIQWEDSNFVSLPCPEGQMKQNEGMLMIWILTPVGSGTRPTALIAERLNKLFISFEESSNGLCGESVRIYNPTGPRRSRVGTEKSFNVQVMSAAIQALEMT